MRYAVVRRGAEQRARQMPSRDDDADGRHAVGQRNRPCGATHTGHRVPIIDREVDAHPQVPGRPQNGRACGRLRRIGTAVAWDR